MKIERMIGEYLQDNGLNISTGTIADAMVICPPSSTNDGIDRLFKRIIGLET